MPDFKAKMHQIRFIAKRRYIKYHAFAYLPLAIPRPKHLLFTSDEQCTTVRAL